MIEDMTVRGFGEKTQSDYIRHVRNFTIFLGRSPDQAAPWGGACHPRAGDFVTHENPILCDGSMATEKLTEYTPGHSFAYEVTGFTNIVLRRLVSGVRGEWTYTPDGSGTVIRWTYEFKPLRCRYWLVRRVLTPLWRHYMQAGVEAAARVAEDHVGSYPQGA